MNKTFDDLLFPKYIQRLKLFRHKSVSKIIKKKHLDEIVDKSFMTKYFSNIIHEHDINMIHKRNL